MAFEWSGPRLIDFTDAQEGFLLAASRTTPNHTTWVDPDTLGGGGGGGATPAGGDGAVQFNDGGSFGGDETTLSWDGSTLRVAANAVLGASYNPDTIIFAYDFDDLGVSPIGTISAKQQNSGGVLAESAKIILESAGAADATTSPGAISFWTASGGVDIVEAVRITSAQSVLLRLPNGVTGLSPMQMSNGNTEPMLAIHNDTDASAQATFAMEAGSSGNLMTFITRRGTAAAPEASLGLDQALFLEAVGYDGQDAYEMAKLVISVDFDAVTAPGEPGDGLMPGQFQFYTSKQDAAEIVEQLRIDSRGGVILPTEFANGSDPAAPVAGARLYIVQTAGDKSQLAVRFPSGAAQIVATEP